MMRLIKCKKIMQKGVAANRKMALIINIDQNT